MAYNKAREERKWKMWKTDEEEQLRRLGMDENSIHELRVMDWEHFKSERRFREHQSNQCEAGAVQIQTEELRDILSVEQLIDSVEDEALLNVLVTADRRMLQIILMKLWGFSVKEIAKKVGIPEQTVYTKIGRLKKKIKKFCSFE